IGGDIGHRVPSHPSLGVVRAIERTSSDHRTRFAVQTSQELGYLNHLVCVKDQSVMQTCQRRLSPDLAQAMRWGRVAPKPVRRQGGKEKGGVRQFVAAASTGRRLASGVYVAPQRANGPDQRDQRKIGELREPDPERLGALLVTHRRAPARRGQMCDRRARRQANKVFTLMRISWSQICQALAREEGVARQAPLAGKLVDHREKALLALVGLLPI